MTQDELAEIEQFRRLIRNAADKASSPWVARAIVKAANEFGPRVSGPSRARQEAIARRDDALRRYHRTALADLSALAAAGMIDRCVKRYADRRLAIDLKQGMPPVNEVEQIVFKAKDKGIGFPKVDRLAEILREN